MPNNTLRCWWWYLGCTAAAARTIIKHCCKAEHTDLSHKICAVTAKLVWGYAPLGSTYPTCLCGGNLPPVLILAFSSRKTPIHPIRLVLNASSSGKLPLNIQRKRELASPLHYYRTLRDGALEKELHLREHLIPKFPTGPDMHDYLLWMKEHFVLILNS